MLGVMDARLEMLMYAVALEMFNRYNTTEHLLTSG
jgi:hypothetical protein